MKGSSEVPGDSVNESAREGADKEPAASALWRSLLARMYRVLQAIPSPPVNQSVAPKIKRIDVYSKPQTIIEQAPTTVLFKDLSLQEQRLQSATARLQVLEDEWQGVETPKEVRLLADWNG